MKYIAFCAQIHNVSVKQEKNQDSKRQDQTAVPWNGTEAGRQASF